MSGAMVHCNGCGFNVEPEYVVKFVKHSQSHCETCVDCRDYPRLKESYRRGFNAGLDAMAAAVDRAAKHSNLRKRPP